VPRGAVVVNNLPSRGRRLGLDVYREVERRVPLSLYGMDSKAIGGEGEVGNSRLPDVLAAHRFFFNPIRYTSLGLAIVEAMMVGLPIVGLATTELVTVIEDGKSGFLDTAPDALVPRMQALLRDPGLARALGERARATALERFSIDRFIADWQRALRKVAG